MDFGLEGKKAFVAGGGRGIGKAIARELAREGCDVAIASRTLDQLEQTAREIEDETGRRCIAMQLDVTDTEQVNRVMDSAVAQLGGLHILVNSGFPARRVTQRHWSGGYGGRRRADGRLRREVRRSPPMRQGRHSPPEGAGLRPHHQHQRAGTPATPAT